MSHTKYNWNATDYAAHSTAQQIWARELIAKLALKGDEHILDIGCGDGKVTAELSKQVPNGLVTGIDNSPAMIDLARNNHPKANHPNLDFLVMDARDIHFDRSFTTAFSNAVLHWVLDHKPVHEGINRVLRPGGTFLLQMGGSGNADGIIASVNDILLQSPWRPFFKNFTFPYGFYSPQEYRPWLTMAGLESIRIELVPKDMIYDTKAKLAGWFRTTWLPYLDKVPANMQNTFIDTVIEHYCSQNPPDRDGKIHVAMVRLEVQGLKPS